ncbi:hypothetical protein [Catenulispora rubra]|uniref:hypothetical protein n=1 Tax=Catenulispora rubra TaxID=280293 RepID=UPI0018927D63|nr:hypothetical protein [Catenulispora rubra]
MPITAGQLDGLATAMHAEAEKHFRANGTVPALWFVPGSGGARLVPMPEGAIDHDLIAQLARADRPSAVLFTGEFWVGTVTVPAGAAAKLSMDDLPRPSEQADRREAIVTRAVGRAPSGGLLHAQHVTHILRTVFGPVQLIPFQLDPAAERSDDFGAFLAALLPNSAGPRRAPRR